MNFGPILPPEVRELFRKAGRKGGMKRNPFKGFGSNGNAKKAAAARWNKTKRKG